MTANRPAPALLTAALAAIAAAPAVPAGAALIARDSFSVDGVANNGDYNVGDLNGQNSTVGIAGFAGNWGQAGTASTGDGDADLGQLSGSLVAGPTFSGLIRTDGSNADRSLFHTVAGVPASGRYFFSFLFDSTSLSNIASLGLTPQGLRNPQPVQGVRVGVNGAAGDIVLIVDSARTVLVDDYSVNTTYFALVEVTNDAAGPDTITASIYSSTAADLSAPLGSATTTGEVTGELTNLALSKQFANSAGGVVVRFDEFRFGTELGDVAVVPEPSSVGLLGLGGLLLAARRRRA